MYETKPTEFKDDLDKLADRMAEIGDQIKELTKAQDEIKEEIVGVMRENDLKTWSFEKRKLSYQSRINYKGWDMQNVKDKVGEDNFSDVTRVSIRTPALRDKLLDSGMEEKEVEDFFDSVAERSESKWVVFRANKD